MAVINLIQKQAHVFKLDGANKLRFTREMPELEQRIEAVEEILDQLAR